MEEREYYREWAIKAMVQIGRDLRQQTTSAEERLWEALRNKRLNNIKFRRQHPIANTTYVVDFLAYASQLIIEVDGSIHDKQIEADYQRQSELESLGYHVLRFRNEQIHNDLENVLTTIAFTHDKLISQSKLSPPID